MKQEKYPEKIQVVWHTERREMTLEGEPVLEYTLAWPELQGAGRGGARINRYYARVARAWRQRWRQEIYWRACLALVQHRAASRPFRPWSGCLEGEVTLQEGNLLSLRMNGTESRGDERICRAGWGDVWRMREGAPCTLAQLMGGRRGWKKDLLSQLVQQGNGRRESGDCFLDSDWACQLKCLPPEGNFCLLPDRITFLFPQCSVAPAAEGVVSLSIPCPAQPEHSEKKISSP